MGAAVRLLKAAIIAVAVAIFAHLVLVVPGEITADPVWRLVVAVVLFLSSLYVGLLGWRNASRPSPVTRSGEVHEC